MVYRLRINYSNLICIYNWRNGKLCYKRIQTTAKIQNGLTEAWIYISDLANKYAKIESGVWG